MKNTNAIFVVISFLAVSIGYSREETAINSVYTKVKEVSSLIGVCKVIDESPNASGPKGSQKSYKVSLESVFYISENTKKLDAFWIYFETQDFAHSFRSNWEASFHKGDRFIAFIASREEKKGAEFRIVRLETENQAERIQKELSSKSEQGVVPNP